MNIIQVIILAIIEGLTEFLPVSSTGHMVVTSALMGIGEDPFVKLFEIVIQLGAILAVVVLYFKRFFRSFDFYIKLVIGVIPAVVLGVLLDKYIKSMLGNPILCMASFPSTTYLCGSAYWVLTCTSPSICIGGRSQTFSSTRSSLRM